MGMRRQLSYKMPIWKEVLQQHWIKGLWDMHSVILFYMWRACEIVLFHYTINNLSSIHFCIGSLTIEDNSNFFKRVTLRFRKVEINRSNYASQKNTEDDIILPSQVAYSDRIAERCNNKWPIHRDHLNCKPLGSHRIGEYFRGVAEK